jgi:hypothetical protein
VVGAALVAAARGKGHRQIAADLDRSPSTVRCWLRVAATPGHLQGLRDQADRTVGLDADILDRLRPAGSALGDVLTALTATVAAVRARLPEVTADTWSLISVITGGRLLLPVPST